MLRKFPGMRFDKARLEKLARDGVMPGLTQVRLDYKKLGKNWREVLEEVLGVVG